MHYIVISTSLNNESRSRIMARFGFELLSAPEGASVEFVDLREYPLPFCDGQYAYSDENVRRLAGKIRRSDAVLVATPVYNFNVSSVLKNLVELTGKSWKDKIVAFLCAAGGRSSYMSVMSFANSLMLDFRCTILPRFVFCTAADFEGQTIAAPEVKKRISELCRTMEKYARALKHEP